MKEISANAVGKYTLSHFHAVLHPVYAFASASASSASNLSSYATGIFLRRHSLFLVIRPQLQQTTLSDKVK
jgi:hypothetical protein